MTQNQIAYHNAKELERHNQAAEAETNRHQLQQEKLQHRSNELAHESNMISKEHYERMDAINATHYQNQDQYNLAMLAESQRANLAGEMLKQQQNAINAATLSETARHQRTMEGIESSLAANTIHRTQSEMSVMSENARYIRGQASKLVAETGYLNAQSTYLLGAQSRDTEAHANVNQENVRTQRTQQFLNTTSAWEHVMNAANKAVSFVQGVSGMIVPVMK